MCKIFSEIDPVTYLFETRSVRLGGHATSIRLEGAFWQVLEEIASTQNVSPATSDWPAAVANDEPPGDTLRCNTDSADATADTDARTPSANTDVRDRTSVQPAKQQRSLAAVCNERNIDEGPREVTLPKVKSRRRVTAPSETLSSHDDGSSNYRTRKWFAKT